MGNKQFLHVFRVFSDGDVDKFRHIVGNFVTLTLEQFVNQSHPESFISVVPMDEPEQLLDVGVPDNRHDFLDLLFILLLEIAIFVEESLLDGEKLNFLKATISPNQSRHYIYFELYLSKKGNQKNPKSIYMNF